jgi:hypothetical protein
MLKVFEAHVIVESAIRQAQAQTSWWQVAIKTALTWLLKMLPQLLPLILAESETRGVALDPNASALAAAARKRSDYTPPTRGT